MTISFCIFFTSQPVRINSVASQSSNSGWDGFSPCNPKSSVVFTKPVPKYCCQKRFTVTRAVKGWFGSTSHLARPSRFVGAPRGSGGRIEGTPGVTLSLFLSYSPRTSMNVSRGFAASFATIVVGMAFSMALSSSFHLATSSKTFFHSGELLLR